MLKKLAIYGAFLLIGLTIGIGYNYFIGTSASSQHENFKCPYDLINPSFCLENSRATFVSQATLERAIGDYISKMQSEDVISRTSVYYRDLQNGPSVNIDADVPYYGGSLLKVPIMILYLKQAEKDKNILDKEILIGDDVQITQLKDPSQSAVRGQKYTILELIRKMIIHSDNSAKDALVNSIPDTIDVSLNVDIVLNEMGIQDEADESGLITLREYAAIFRSLYNSQYLSPEMSQLALEILAESGFDRGIMAGLPRDVIVANKFGIPEATSSANLQLHDCGIVYHTRSPYGLCIFTEGSDYLSIEKVIIEISEAIYVLVDKAK